MTFDVHRLIQFLPLLAIIALALINTRKARNGNAAKILDYPDLSKVKYITNPHALKDGQPTLLECFATWCGPCRQQIPHLADLQKKYPYLNVLSVSQESFNKIYQFATAHPSMQEYNVAADDDQSIGKYMNQQGVRGIPHCFLFDSYRRLVWNGHPMNVESYIREVLK